MGVQVKAWKGAWWIFVDHKGQRKAKRIGTGKEGHRAAIAAAPVAKFVGHARVQVDIFTREDLTRLLVTAAQEMPKAYPLVLRLARTGLRIGEALT